MTLLAGGLGLIVLGGIAARGLQSRPRVADALFRLGLLVGAFTAVTPALRVLMPGSEVAPASAGGWYGLDPLSAWFLVIVLGAGTVAALYGIPYLDAERGHRPVGTAHLLLAILLVALSGVVTARTIVAFLTAWEVMAISAWLLVVFENEQADVRRAGLIYLVLTHASTIALLAMFAAWSGGNIGLSFADLVRRGGNHPPAALVLTFALAGFGIKAGMVPAHFWLPGAHAAAPSHISAVLSGVMLKVGIYGLLRVLMLVGPAPAWWGWVVLLLGLASAVLGVLWALAQHDLKRLLAYHSVENIGIILIGVGLGALGTTYRQPGLAVLGFTGAVLHSFNHALFKSLLFLGAGAVGRVAGTREIGRLGGIARAAPATAAAFLLGSLAIVGLPPLNGFVSEWLIFRGLIDAGSVPGALHAAAAAATGLGLTGALALACFTKVHGTVFLGTPRQELPGRQSGSEQGLVAPQWVLAAACVVIGVLPGVVLPVAARPARAVLGEAGAAAGVTTAAGSAGAISGLALALAVVGAAIWLLRRSRAGARTRDAETWGCAYPAVTSRMQYTASSYAAGLLGLFGRWSGSRVVASEQALHVQVADPVLDRVGLPLWARVQRAASSLRVIQTGRLRWYLLYVIFTLLALLFYLWMAT